MDFKKQLISGTLIKRYKRFLVDVKIKDKVITCHCPNTGSMMGLLKTGNKVWLSLSDDPKRKLQYTLQLIQVNNALIGINTHLTNKIFFEALKKKKIHNFGKPNIIKPEYKFKKGTRFDFYLENNKKKILIEIKNVTLSRNKHLAEFPDAITERGHKHIEELLNAKKIGFEVYLIFVVQRNDCKYFSIAKDIDEKYDTLLTKALSKGVNVFCYDCKMSTKGIIINKKLIFQNNE